MTTRRRRSRSSGIARGGLLQLVVVLAIIAVCVIATLGALGGLVHEVEQLAECSRVGVDATARCVPGPG